MWGGKRPAGGGGGRGGGGYGGRGGGGGGSSSAHAAKRPKPSGDDDDDMGGEDEFIDEMLEDEEEMLADMSGPPPPEEDMDLAGKCLTVKDIDALTRKWKRPPLPPPNEAEQELSFQQLECDYTIANRPVEFARGSTEARAAAVRMYGVTNEGHSILAHIHGFLPYFWVKAPPGFTPEHAEKFKVTLNARVKAGLNARDMCEAPIVDVRLLARKSIMGYQFDAQAPFLRIVTALPSLVATCRRVLENGVPVPTGGSFQFETYESNWAYVLRFMVDREVTGMCWNTIAAGKWKVRPWNSGPKGELMAKTSHCQLELDVWFADVVSHKPEGEFEGIAPLRILSFDIECAGRPGVFPEAEKDPVIQIANHVTLQGENAPVFKNVFTLDTCASISGAQVVSFEKEADMLKAWSEFVRQCDPDLMTGYNIINFDLPYLLDRASALKIKGFPYLGRLITMPTRMKDKMFQSKQVGTRESKEINIEGRVQFDVLQVLQRDYKLSSYSLNAVCAHFLGEQKEDVHHSIISDLQAGNADTRRRLAVYCLKDAYLPQRLLSKLMCIINYTEMARVTGVPLSYLLTRGQQIKVMSQLYRKCRKEGLLIPTAARKAQEGDKFEGATVIEPKKGFYREPVATLDFASLYPSIMMAHNLCYSTLVKGPQNIARLPPDSYAKSPTGDVFVKADTCKGILPQVLEELLAARKQAKADMKAEKAKGKDADMFKYAVYDGRQLALKVSANSVYGFTGAQVGQLPCLEISSTVTAYGRQMIESTKAQVEAHYSTANGKEHDAVVVYGDTDSVMIKFGTADLKEAMAMGQEAADMVTRSFIKPIKLEFEKVYYPYLLMNKKRYAGLLWTKPEKHDYMDMKGIETARRDNCALTRDIVDTSLRAILINKDVETAIAYIKMQISNLLQNKIDMSKLVITKALTRTADNYANKQAHVELAARIKKRDPGMAPAIGDRVPYVMIKGAVGAKAYEKAEDPVYVLENNVPIDATWYLEHQLSEPIKRLFEPILPDNVQSLLEGAHTRKISKATPTMGGLMKFAKVTLRCLGCKTAIDDGQTACGGQTAVCHNCYGKMAAVYMTALSNYAECERVWWLTHVEVQRVSGDFHKDIIGIARDSPLYYKMKKTQKDLAAATLELKRFEVAA